MSLSYATFVTRILQWLQDTGAATFDATETGYAIENELKRLSRYVPALIDVIFKIESREGSDTAGTASKLTDTTKSQFLSTDDDNQKVIHNITDDTWAVVTGYTSTSVLTLSANIMASGEEYEIYNKRCRNKRQIYIGDMPPYLWVDSVEYPVGTERNFIRVSKDIIELEVDDALIEDSNSTLSPLNNVDVLVKFALPQVLCQLTDLAGACTNIEPVDETTLAVKNLTGSEIIEVGELLNIAGHKQTYIVATGVTLSSGAGDIVVYPGMESATAVDDVITFVKSTLKPNDEEILEQLVAAALKVSDAERHRIQALADMVSGRALINTTNLGGSDVAYKYSQYAGVLMQIARELVASAREQQAIAIRRLQGLAQPRMARVLPMGTVSV